MSSFASPPSTTPARIHAYRPARLLQIEWRDGHQTEYDFTDLRWLCPCAVCRGEGGMPGWLDSSPTLSPMQTALVDLHLVGSYAIAPSWADGHQTGYYSFASLRDNCGCAECMARRGNAAPGADPGRRHRDHAREDGGTR